MHAAAALWQAGGVCDTQDCELNDGPPTPVSPSSTISGRKWVCASTTGLRRVSGHREACCTIHHGPATRVWTWPHVSRPGPRVSRPPQRVSRPQPRVSLPPQRISRPRPRVSPSATGVSACATRRPGLLDRSPSSSTPARRVLTPGDRALAWTRRRMFPSSVRRLPAGRVRCGCRDLQRKIFDAGTDGGRGQYI